MSCFAGIITGIMSFANFSSFERFNRSYAAGIMFFISSESCLLRRDVQNICSYVNHYWQEPPDPSLSAFFVLLGMAIYTGVTVHFLGRRFGDWRFSWSYILGWVAMLMTFFAGEKGQNTYFNEKPIWFSSSSKYKPMKQNYFDQHYIIKCILSVAGIFYICAYRECECRRGNRPR